MRLSTTTMHNSEQQKLIKFSKLLLDIGNGGTRQTRKLRNDEEDANLIKIQKKYITTS